MPERHCRSGQPRGRDAVRLQQRDPRRPAGVVLRLNGRARPGLQFREFIQEATKL